MEIITHEHRDILIISSLSLPDSELVYVTMESVEENVRDKSMFWVMPQIPFTVTLNGLTSVFCFEEKENDNAKY